MLARSSMRLIITAGLIDSSFSKAVEVASVMEMVLSFFDKNFSTFDCYFFVLIGDIFINQ